jgi:hypothetical protein
VSDELCAVCGKPVGNVNMTHEADGDGRRAVKGIASVQKNAADAKVVDLTE